MVKTIPDMQWAHDIMTGQKPFPAFNKKSEDKGFKELPEKEMELKEGKDARFDAEYQNDTRRLGQIDGC